ncbi:hypothetical protein CC1G_09698 [Coprinopsis cinerea okayama7|uniref:BAG domain-containing protein n=1 Tax=Coprinopsis cinerea (strain Okayama-7 / 130 / ATCC MYA-4618 / FGSC 9003) TaxID=240176 RepID=A8NJD2_COPC7|nr:hypothetical protein CC1G_09698 [Coprinopsis cinerea okayama7\|eukprot:XP_001834198.2 hypothetical protein CC1G_09698 [Coprinopsis cinerea okayama7\
MFSPYGYNYFNPRPQRSPWGYPQQRHPRGYYNTDEDDLQERARALAEQRARRAQWLPDEVDDDDDWEYRQLPPRERMYIDAARRRQQLEQQQRIQHAARERALEEQRWQQQLEQRQKEEDARRQRILEEQRKIQQQKRERMEARLREEAERRQAQAKARSASPSPEARPAQIPIDDATQPTPNPPSPQPEEEQSPIPEYDERHHEAATLIQNKYRIHRSLKAIDELRKEFYVHKDRFSFPSSIDFQKPGGGEGYISVPAPPPSDETDESSPMDVDGQPDGKLAYTSHNYNIHAYNEFMMKQLTKLDGVESFGEKAVRNRRRGVVKEIEREILKLENWWKRAWREYVASQEPL